MTTSYSIQVACDRINALAFERSENANTNYSRDGWLLRSVPPVGHSGEGPVVHGSLVKANPEASQTLRKQQDAILALEADKILVTVRNESKALDGGYAHAPTI
jgi:hypothetical protein